ncbi:histidine phosphatase family protein [Microvirga flavescens]|uniref:histidine phosphatase family protein n=1 Tax=Microvirga flavescens TaxID=2249811 RepID=UPI000DDB0F76|nr:histidine phosphatase family protein [Microvirga flavescens]
MPKIVHCIRHGQSTFNARYDETGEDPLFFDAPLTDLGHTQAADAAALHRGFAYELVVTSPLTRALQTTRGIFGNHPVAPPIVVESLHREYLLSSCDVGREPVHLARDFPDFAFAHLDEVWWHRDDSPDERGLSVEPLDHLAERVKSFRSWLSARPEGLIAVVGHGTFFRELTGTFLRNCEMAAIEL